MNNHAAHKRYRYTRLIKWTFRLLSGLAVAVIYYLVFSLFFDTPIEYELKRSTRKIEAEYQALNARYDTLQAVLENVVARDANVYKILFESEPEIGEDQDHQCRIEFSRELGLMTNKEMGELFEERLVALQRQAVAYRSQDQRLADSMIRHVNEVVRIPAIQPVDNHQLTLLTASFGQRVHPFFKTMSQHNGVDYSVAIGTAVFATADGMVQSVQRRGQTSGLAVSINHENGYQTLYSNLDKVVLEPGRRVNRGDIIAFSGNTGLSFAPHLHYEVHYRGLPVDPLNYFFMELDMPAMERLRAISRMGMQSFD